MDKRYDIVYADPPWKYYGDPNKHAAAGKHYDLMDESDIANIDCLGAKQSCCFMWATGPKLDVAIRIMNAWGYHYRGVAFVWVKTTKAGKIIHGQGVPPTATKPTTEFVLLGTRKPRGRPFPLLDAAVPQVICAPRRHHSAKPFEARDMIVRLYGDRPRVELFARETAPGWDSIGDELTGQVL